MKTEAAKGVREYTPKINMAVNKEIKSDVNWEKNYKEDLINRIRECKALKAKTVYGGAYNHFVLFNGNLENPAWTWDLEKLENSGIELLRNLAVIIEKT